MSSATKAGLIGEHLSAAAILQIGQDRWSAGLVQQDKVDVIAWDDVGFIRVQVKSSHLRRHRSSPVFAFNVGSGLNKRIPTKEDHDIVCFCAIELRKVYFYPTCAINKVTYRWKQGFFETKNLEEDSWNYAVEMVRSNVC